MAWLLIIPFLLVLAALPVAFGAVAVRPSQATLRAAAVMLLAFAVAVILVILAGVIA